MTILRPISRTTTVVWLSLILAAVEGDEYLQSAIDDFCSFFYTAQWSVVFNLKSEQNLAGLLVLRLLISGNCYESSTATLVMTDWGA